MACSRESIGTIGSWFLSQVPIRAVCAVLRQKRHCLWFDSLALPAVCLQILWGCAGYGCIVHSSRRPASISAASMPARIAKANKGLASRVPRLMQRLPLIPRSPAVVWECSRDAITDARVFKSVSGAFGSGGVQDCSGVRSGVFGKSSFGVFGSVREGSGECSGAWLTSTPEPEPRTFRKGSETAQDHSTSHIS